MSCWVSMMRASTPALHQPLGLLEEDPLQRVRRDVAEGRVGGGGEHAGRADGAGHEARVVRGGEPLGGAAGQDGGAEVDLVGAVAEAVLVELEARGAEGVGLHHVAAGGEVAAVDGLHEIGAGQGQQVVGPLLAAEVGDRELLPLDLRAHGPVEDEDPPGDGLAEGHGVVWLQTASRSPAARPQETLPQGVRIHSQNWASSTWAGEWV